MSTKLVPKAWIVLPVPVKPIHKQTNSLDVPINLDCLPFQFFQLVILAEWASREKWQSGTGLTCLCLSPESQFIFYHQNRDWLHSYCSGHLRLSQQNHLPLPGKGTGKENLQSFASSFCASLPTKTFLHCTNGIAAVAWKSLGLSPHPGVFNCIQLWHLYKHRQQKLCVGPVSRLC